VRSPLSAASSDGSSANSHRYSPQRTRSQADRTLAEVAFTIMARCAQQLSCHRHMIFYVR
jgi:hypothetical protein